MKTYRQLLEALKTLDEEQLDCDITIFKEDEYQPKIFVTMSTDVASDILDTNHPFFLIEDPQPEMSEDESQWDPFWNRDPFEVEMMEDLLYGF